MQITKQTDKWLICAEEQWSQFFQDCNWYTFDSCHFQIEHDVLMGSIGVSIYVMGLGVSISHAYKVTEAAIAVKKQVEDISREQ